jgi:DNA-nicking Smr family endonuclease
MDDDAPVEVPVDGVLDLHAFDPREVKDLVTEYIEECARRGVTEIRIIHGKGTGTLRKIVRGLLGMNPRVLSFRDAGPGGGSWGATEVRISSGENAPGGS